MAGVVGQHLAQLVLGRFNLTFIECHLRRLHHCLVPPGRLHRLNAGMGTRIGSIHAEHTTISRIRLIEAVVDQIGIGLSQNLVGKFFALLEQIGAVFDRPRVFLDRLFQTQQPLFHPAFGQQGFPLAERLLGGAAGQQHSCQ